MRTVFAISDNTVTEIVHVNPYLIFTSRLQIEFYQRKTAVTSQYLITSNRQLPLIGIIGRINLESRIFGQIRTNHSLGLLHHALDYCHIFTFQYDIVPIMLQLFLYSFAFSKHHQTRSIPIETMHDEQLVLRVLGFHIIAEYTICCSGLYTFCRHRKQSIPLIYDNDILIFINHLQTIVFKHTETSLKINFQFVPNMQHRVELGNRHIIDSDLPVRQIRFDRRAAFVPKQSQ